MSIRSVNLFVTRMLHVPCNADPRRTCAIGNGISANAPFAFCRTPLPFTARVTRASLYGAQVFLSFFLMLVFMTYNVSARGSEGADIAVLTSKLVRHTSFSLPSLVQRLVTSSSRPTWTSMPSWPGVGTTEAWHATEDTGPEQLIGMYDRMFRRVIGFLQLCVCIRIAVHVCGLQSLDEI